MKLRYLATLIASFGCAGLLSACTVGAAVRIAPQSHYTNPGTNLKRLGDVSVSMPGGIGFFNPPVMSSKVEKKLYDKAIAQSPGADLIVDFVETTQLQMIPVGMFNIYLSTHKLKGTAAKIQ